MAQLDNSRRYGASPKTSVPASVDQLLQAGDPQNLPVAASPSFRRDYEQEDDHNPPSKKSVLAKVREKAKKWKQTLVKKKHDNDDNATPAWGVNLEDENEEEEDPEYLGAPMYESELAPEGYKETARQHPRAIPVIPESHVLPSNARNEANDQPKESTPIPNATKTITETVTEKLAPAYATVAEATQTIASKIQGLTVAAATSTPTTGGNGSSSEQQIWDKGVSVKEYLMNKLEPGEDERALSQVISDAISPRKTPGEMGVVEKVREAVTMLLRNGESSPSTTATIPKSSSNIPITKPSSISPISTKSPSNISISTNSASLSPLATKSPPNIPISTKLASQTPLATNLVPQLPLSTNSASQVPLSSKSQTHIPISTNAYEANVEEENHGRILQTN
ncbi:hypothetical protein CK203_068396 [Vitis vinifera]|uniref:Low-temperature-induced 65 kDa protein n=1 Tax=Vitis vinifera TaxID=29760 RepID=A0A438F382_VITVI|nr:hypothetical protein CK203_068396 [Vitis vinifera]